MSLPEALARTLLLMRDEVYHDTPDEVLLAALTGTHVALVANESNIRTHAAQTAFVTAAILMARSGHKVFLIAPNVPLVGNQPPLRQGGIIEQLINMGEDMLPGVSFETELDGRAVDLAIGFGDTPLDSSAQRRIWTNAEAWAGTVMPENKRSQWLSDSWPMGALTAAALVSAEAFKSAMQRLRPYARNLGRLDTVFAYTDEITFALAPSDTPMHQDLGRFDCVSGGAIINAALYTLYRIPGVNGCGRVIEPETAAISNLNRYMLLRRSRLDHSKADDLAHLLGDKLRLEAIQKRFEPNFLNEMIAFAPAVLVGVDHIPTRWAVQEAKPEWLGIGATTHWSAMASFHSAGLGCARCLHNEDDPADADIPTVAFVSFWGGLLLAAYFLRHLARTTVSFREQQIYLTAFRAENPSRAPVPLRRSCPTCAAIYPTRQAG